MATVTEINAFPPSMVGVQTAVPAFIGYTQKATAGGKTVFLKPIAIASLADFEAAFGGGFQPIYNLKAIHPGPSPAPGWDFDVGSGYYELEQAGQAQFYLYPSMRFFFNNGGGNCYVVSVGDYTNLGQSPNGVTVSEGDLGDGITAIRDQAGPTMLVIPDATLLPDSGAFSNIVQGMLRQCGELQDRVAILDVYDSLSVTQANINTQLDQVITAFQDGVGSNSLNYGMAYFPFLHTSVLTADDVNYTFFNPEQAAASLGIVSSPPGGTALQALLEEVADSMYEAGTAARQTVQGYIDGISTIVEDPNDPDNESQEQKILALNQNLSNALPPYQQWQDAIRQKMNILPPGGGMAGVFTLSDQTHGVWNAPANMSMASVTSCTVKLNDDQQGGLNVPLNGKAVNAIRDFIGRGSVVWGARTLDGNSNDWRYIQVRRTIVYIEQSIKSALNPFAFAANDGQTWVTVTSMISSFLQGVWLQGGLMGDKASDAFAVQCGLGSTMTAQDILDGYMVVQVSVQMIRPAEFIELTFKQQMQGA
ncbi:MAG: phage tail sheath C-terminal domain-containing protein [Terriglobia bacterium]